jgi:Spx/MgsR family transcriptional regulator
MTNIVTLYGIPNCDTIKKARGWLREHDIDHVFHDYRKHGIERDQLQSMMAQLGWETMLNRRGSTWRAVPEDTRATIGEASALSLMLDNPAIIKRPILDAEGRLHIGFSSQQYEEIFTRP